MENINSLNREVRNSLDNLPIHQGSVRNGVPVNRNASPPTSQYTGHNQTNNNFSGRRGRRNAIVPGDIPENFQNIQKNRRERAKTQVQQYEEPKTDPLDKTTRPPYNPQKK